MIWLVNIWCLAKEYEDEMTVKGTPFPQDADYQSSNSDDSSEDGSDSDASEDDEDEAALLREYAKIKKEREETERKKEEEKAKIEEEKRQKEIMKANPLVTEKKEDEEEPEDYSIQRKWYDETVFKNQARVEKKKKKRFINDTVRSDFHRDFLNRFVQ